MGSAPLAVRLTLLLVSTPTLALAQAAPAPKPAEDAKIEGVTLTAQELQARSSIDRRSYAVSDELVSSSGSAADVLRTIPSVEVDAQGGLRLRGDANVTVLIDGRRSATAASSLQQMPASQIERVEVITNPSAAFNPQGGAIINIVTKRGRGEGPSGQARVGLGDQGRQTLGLSAAYNSRNLALNADIGLRTWIEQWIAEEKRVTINGGSGVESDGESRTVVRNPGDARTAKFSADYDLTEATRLSGGVSYVRYTSEGTEGYDFESRDAATGALSATRRDGTNVYYTRTVETSAALRHKFGEGHDLVIDLKQEDSSGRFDREVLYSVPRARYERYLNFNDPDGLDIKIDYKRPLGGEAKLALGYEGGLDDAVYDNRLLRGWTAATAVPDPATSLFDYRQDVHAVYATYERPLGEVKMLAGVRAETVETQTFEHTTGDRGGNDYVEIYPSLHLTRPVGEGTKLSWSYSRRVQRPNAFDLNPARFPSPIGFRQGNPDLLPQITDSFEAGYEYRMSGKLYGATAYYRKSRDGVVSTYTDLGDGVLLQGRENAGGRTNIGLELVASGKLTPTLSYNTSTNIFWTEVSAPALGVGAVRSGVGASGRISLDWQAGPKDTLQISIANFGKRVDPQGYRINRTYVNIGYRHKLDERLTATVTVQDLLGDFGATEVIDTPLIKSRLSTDYFDFKSIYVGLTYAFGAKRRGDRGFEFGGG